MAERGYVYHRGGLTAAQRDAALADFDARLEAVVHYSQNAIGFEAWPPPARAATGQAFGSQVEVRWRPDGPGTFEVVVISEQAQTALSSWTLTEMDVDAAEKPYDSLYLWGEHWRSLRGAGPEAPDGWVQARIEADLDYPVADGGKQKPVVRVGTRTYRQQGVIRLTRFVAVQAAARKE